MSVANAMRAGTGLAATAVSMVALLVLLVLLLQVLVLLVLVGRLRWLMVAVCGGGQAMWQRGRGRAQRASASTSK